MTTAPEVERFGTMLTRLVTEARAAEPARYAAVTSWTDLHDVCDANEFVLEAEEALGLTDLDAAVDLFNAAIDTVEAALWPTTERTPA